ncbi:hypothetical protein [Arcanobacterium hippocoleae]|uniref:Phosphotransferase system IIB component n=1 Tax=Arcanobacterium hippocoleae TaxID=149017 RepID=A0ABU1T1B1_9ACTO|nr:hypothetical protein [Arcanobacterium hippocoleae]MDR6939158.1 phosphotransferase system IIB component [Arcanobacterium hippocoleae]
MIDEQLVPGDLNSLGGEIIIACGGVENILGADSVVSRLIIQIDSNFLVNVEQLRKLGIISVILQRRFIHLVVGELAEPLHYLLVKLLDLRPDGY